MDRAPVPAVAEMHATGTSARKAQGIAERLGAGRLPEGQAGAMAQSPDADVEELLGRPLGDAEMPCIWPGATCVKCRREGHVASTAIATAIGCDSRGWRHVPGISVVDTGPHGSWPAFLESIRTRGAMGIQLVVSDAHEGLERAMAEVLQGAAWQRCAVHPMRGCMRAAGPKGLARRVARIVAPVFRAKDAAAVRAPCHVAADMLRERCPKAAGVWEEAEADAPACPGLPASRWKGLRTSSVQERTSRETRRRPRAVQAFPSTKPPERLVGAAMGGQDEERAGSRCLSERKMAEPCDPSPSPEPATQEGQEKADETAGKAMEAGPGLADRMEAA